MARPKKTRHGEVIATPGTESNVKEIFDKCWELRKSGQDLMIFNQFEEFGNYLWHYTVTGAAMEEVLKNVMGPNDRYRGMASATGSAGTIASVAGWSSLAFRPYPAASPARSPFTATIRLRSDRAGRSGSVEASGGGTTP